MFNKHQTFLIKVINQIERKSNIYTHKTHIHQRNINLIRIGVSPFIFGAIFSLRRKMRNLTRSNNGRT